MQTLFILFVIRKETAFCQKAALCCLKEVPVLQKRSTQKEMHQCMILNWKTMKAIINPEKLVVELSVSLGQKGEASEEVIQSLLSLSRHNNPSIREAAIHLLLHPPVSDELSFHRRLIVAAVRDPVSKRRLPVVLAEFLLDALAVVGSTSAEKHGSSSAGALLNAAAVVLGRGLFRKPISLQDLLYWISPRLLFGLLSCRQPVWKNRWRVARKRILRASASSPEMTLTLRDLQTVCPEGRISAGLRKGPRRWLVTGRSLLFKEIVRSIPIIIPVDEKTDCAERLCAHVRAFPGETLPISSISWWGGKGSRTFRFWERIIDLQTEELRGIRAFVREASRRTRRVILSLHNATLAAAGGWAFEPLDHSFPSLSSWASFVAVTRSAEQRPRESRMPDARIMEELRKQWEKRLVTPHLIHALWQSRVRSVFDPSWTIHHERDLALAMERVEMETLTLHSSAARCSWQSTVAPHQRRSVGEILHWMEERRRLSGFGYDLLAAFIREGQKLLSSGCIESFVLPWIDKFFISSHREQDSHYLPILLRWLRDRDVDPIVIFWEDTSHCVTPSFKLALDRMKSRNLPVRGIGVFDEEGSKREEALSIVCNTHHETQLFSLRPFDDAHNPIALSRLLETKDPRLFRPYDSSWKDNLCFLYAGTQVAPLLSVQCDGEGFSSWVAVDHHRLPFGTYFRWRLRRGVLGYTGTFTQPVSIQYAAWANLL